MQNVSGKTTVFRCVTSTTYRREPPYNPVIPSVAQHFAKNCFAIRLECRLNASPYLKPAWARPCLPARAGGNRRNAEIKAKGEGDHPACTKPQSQERTGIPLWVPYFRVAGGTGGPRITFIFSGQCSGVSRLSEPRTAPQRS
jgi:hypothetical protein